MSQMIMAVVLGTAMIFTMMTVSFATGPIIDDFEYRFSLMDNGWEGPVVFVSFQETTNTLFEWSFAIPIFFAYVYIFWMFKVVIAKHLYSREKTNGNDYQI